MAAPLRLAGQPSHDDRGDDRQPGLHRRTQAGRDRVAPADRPEDRVHRRQGLQRPRAGLAGARPCPRQAPGHGALARRYADRGRPDRGEMGGRSQGGACRLQARLGQARQGRAVQAQRPDARRPADRRRRVPGRGHLRQLGRQGPQARHSALRLPEGGRGRAPEGQTPPARVWGGGRCSKPRVGWLRPACP